MPLRRKLNASSQSPPKRSASLTSRRKPTIRPPTTTTTTCSPPTSWTLTWTRREKWPMTFAWPASTAPPAAPCRAREIPSAEVSSSAPLSRDATLCRRSTATSIQCQTETTSPKTIPSAAPRVREEMEPQQRYPAHEAVARVVRRPPLFQSPEDTSHLWICALCAPLSDTTGKRRRSPLRSTVMPSPTITTCAASKTWLPSNQIWNHWRHRQTPRAG